MAHAGNPDFIPETRFSVTPLIATAVSIKLCGVKHDITNFFASAKGTISSHAHTTVKIIQSSLPNRARRVVDAFLRRLSHLIIQAADWVKEHPTEAAIYGAIIIIFIVLLATSPQILAAIGFTNVGPAVGKARIVKS